MTTESEFMDLCCHGQLNEAKMFLATYPRISYISDIFDQTCISGQLDVAKWLLETFPSINIRASNDYVFRYTAEEGHTEVLRWLLTIPVFEPINVHAEDEDAFRSACKNGHLETVKWLLETFPDIDVRISNGWAFRRALSNNHLEVVKFLCPQHKDLDPETIRENIREKLLFGSVETVEWLQQSYPDVKPEGSTFRYLCGCGTIGSMKLFLKIFPDVIKNPYECFLTICSVGNLEKLEFILENFPQIDVHADYEMGYRIMCSDGRADMMRWFLEKFPETCV